MLSAARQASRYLSFPALAALLLAAASPLRAADPPKAPPSKDALAAIATFAQQSSLFSMALSPDGKRIAGLAHNGRGGAVFLMDLDTFATRTLVESKQTNSYLRSPVGVVWIEPDLLGVNFNDREAESIDLAGRKVAGLGERVIRRARSEAGGPPEVIALRDIAGGDYARVDARTGKAERYRIGLPGDVLRLAFDSQARLRAAMTLEASIFKDKGVITNWYRRDDASEWQKLEAFGLADDVWEPLFALDAPDTLAIRSRVGRDTWAVFRYDAAKKAQGDMMAGHPTQDIEAFTAADDATFTSVSTEGLKPLRYWFDERMAALQNGIDAALPDRVNVLSNERGGKVVVYTAGDVDPGRWLLLDVATLKLRELEARLPGVDPTRMRPMQALVYPSRDGTPLNAYLTTPKNAAGPGPLVVLIHGGPQVRDHWEWNAEVQLLASRGYTVFQPQFRGSVGFGKRYEAAGFGQWGRRMQDDISDGVRHLVARGIADPRRVCISGASYGGYAVLWRVISTPELYRCGISYAGVSDLAALSKASLFTDSSAASRELNRARVGDPDKQRRELDEVSPLQHAAAAGAPLLIAHGERDVRVPSWHSERMVKALQAAGKPVEWMPFENEGHGFYWVRNEIRFRVAMLAFLERYIGPALPETAAPAAPPSSAAFGAASAPP